MPDLRVILPRNVFSYRGAQGAAWFTLLVAIIITARSPVHVFRADGGASSIAGIDIEVESGHNLVAMFAQWGLEQLLLAAVAWLAILRYRGLIPLVLLINLLDVVGRIAVGRAKPLEVAKPPPGACGSWIGFPLLAVALWCLLPRKRERV